jgi:DNA-binding transcriptional MerR regulator
VSEASLREMADALNVSTATVRHWLRRFDLQPKRRRRVFNGEKPKLIVDVCRLHGETKFTLEGRGAYRCKRCRSESVSEWRRRMKRLLIEEAGGRCAVCGYDRHPGALHFTMWTRARRSSP